jgi:hypothetical protein
VQSRVSATPSRAPAASTMSRRNGSRIERKDQIRMIRIDRLPFDETPRLLGVAKATMVAVRPFGMLGVPGHRRPYAA